MLGDKKNEKRIIAMSNLQKFSEAKAAFDADHANAATSNCIVPVRGKVRANDSIRNVKGEPNEQYYKWQFVYGLVHSGLYPKDYIGVEVHFPKGNKGSAALQLDGAIFDDAAWVGRYNAYWNDKQSSDLEWLNDHLLATIEFKKNDKEIEKVFAGQIRPAMREKEPSDAYVLGMYYDAERLYMFHRRSGLYLRYDESKNQKGLASKVGDLSLHLPDPYAFIPSFEELKAKVHKPTALNRAVRGISDLDVITTISSVQIQTALSDVLRAMDKAGLVNQRGYQILVQTLALKIFDEKRNEVRKDRHLQFFVTDEEASFSVLGEPKVQGFVDRMTALRADASAKYQKILKNNEIDWKNPSHVRVVVAISQAFHDYSFARSARSDLYQLVFYNFANSFKRDEAAQFLTPLPVIDFVVRLVNPRDGETVLDPCCGIGDFLSLSFVNASTKASGWQLDDANIYGVDLDENMITLATLNMLLNGDGEAKLFDKPDKGSILYKIAQGSPPALVSLLPDHHKHGNWDNWPDQTKLQKFDVVLTNPPFGEDRAYRVKSETDRRIIETYETWHITRDRSASDDGSSVAKAPARKSTKGSDSIDLGIVFLENAYRMLKDDGRLGIVLSNSIASINRWTKIREWLATKLRLVAFFDLPSNVFAETGVNTSILVAYKPKANELKRLSESGYSIYARDIQRVGYEKRTLKRNVFFNPIFQMDETTFDIRVDTEGRPLLDEEFTETISDFRAWALGQEETLQRLFLKEG